MLIVFLQFMAMSALQAATGRALSSDPTNSHLTILKLQMIYLIATIGSPAVLMAIMLTKSVRKTLKLYMPSPGMLAAAVVLPLVLRPVSVELLHLLEPFFPKAPPGMEKFVAALRNQELPGWIGYLAIVVCPGLCEEVAFRGFMLSGLQRSKSFWLPILMSSFAFGVIHLIPQQVFNAFLMGIVLGILAVKSRSLIPPILFHLINNGLEVFAMRNDIGPLERGLGKWFFEVQVNVVEKGVVHPLPYPQLRYTPLMVGLGVFVASLILFRIVTTKQSPDVAERRAGF